ncbi:MAG TPA: hypothetical protein VL125_00655 [Pelobium sp.]|nr:hypothetical protein [Pelobium sp.]
MEENPFINKVLSSKTFAQKEVLKGLLRFLYDASKTKESLKEADIAIGFFKRGSDFVPGEDTIVRVTVYKLRTLLEKYYLEEGRKDTEIIEIPKGSYSIVINRKGRSTTVSSRKKNAVLKILLVVLLLSLSGNIWLLIRKKSLDTNLYNPVWASYIKSGQPVFITLGDPFFFRINNPSVASNKSLIVRDIDINSKEELDANKPIGLQEKQSNISELSYPYFSRNNLWPLPDIISVFAKAFVEIRLQTLSESNIDDIKNNNVIFMGNINSFSWMNRFLDNTSIRLHSNPRTIKILNGKDSVTLSVPEQVKGNYIDYAFLVKMPGPNNNLITMMGDFHASGLRGLSGFLSKKASLQKLEREINKKYGNFPEYFEMVVKVTSYNYSDFDTQMIYFKPLKE